MTESPWHTRSWSPATLETLAGRLAQAQRTATPIEPPSVERPLSLPEAYAVQMRGVRARVAAGGTVTGHKVGLTSQAMQAMYGISEPDFGHLFADMEIHSGATVAVADLCDPRVEPELAFRLGAPLVGPDVTAADVLAATSSVHACIEVIDSRVGSERAQLADSVADNAAAARYAVAVAGRAPFDIAFDRVSADLVVDGERHIGRSEAVMGHPANAVAWLANTLAELGVVLEAGHVVLSGSMTRAVPVRRGSHVSADFGSIGRVSLTFK